MGFFDVLGVIGGGLIGGPLGAAAAGKVIGEGKKAGAASEAAQTQVDFANRAIEEQRRQIEEFRGLLNPFVQGGSGALAEIQDLLGLGGARTDVLLNGELAPFEQKSAFDMAMNVGRHFGQEDATREALEKAGFSTRVSTGADRQAAQIQQLEESPIAQALFQQGEDAILQNASATGGLRGGNVQRALSQFRPNVVNDLINQRFNRLSGLAQLGQSSAAGVGNAGLQTGQAIGGILQSQGDARAQAQLARGNIFGSLAGAPFDLAGALGGKVAGAALGKLF